MAGVEVGVGWYKQWIRLWPLPALGGFGGTFFVLRPCSCPLGCGGGVRKEGRVRNPRLERGVEVGGRVGRLFAWVWWAERYLFEGWFYFFLNCDKF